MRRRLQAAICLLLALVLGEAAVRLWDGLRGGSGSLYTYVVPAGDRFKMRPNSVVIVPERYGDIRYRFNHLGYRDDEPAVGRGLRRIVLLGDSVAFGLGVDQDRMFASLLERRVQRESGASWEVANLAMFAYDTSDEFSALSEDGLALHPELVVVQFYMNDFSITVRHGGSASPPRAGARFIALKNRLLFSSALYRRLHQAGAGLTYLLVHGPRRRWFQGSLNDAEARGELAMLQATPDDESVGSFRFLRRIRDLARAHRSRTLVLLMPDEVQLFSRRYDGINRRIAAFCHRQGIALYDPLSTMRRSSRRTAFYLDGVHLTPEGNRLVAQLLYVELRRRGLLGNASAP